MVSMRKNDQSVDWRGVNSPAMVSDTVQLEKCTKYSDNDNGDECDDVSVASSTDSRVECDGAVVLNDVEDRNPCFQNIEVTNSSDVHFGNKTYYQGPVTIKQILYTNPSQNDEEEPSDQKLPITDACGTDNNGYIPDSSNGIVKNANVNNNNNHNSNWTNKTKGKKWLQRRTSKQLILGTAILILIMLAIIASTIAFLTKYIPKNQLQIYDEEIDSNKPNNDPEEFLNLTSRLDWVASPPSKTVQLKPPVHKVIILETETASCYSRAECIFTVRHLQWNHMDGRSFWDIKYNFIVGGDGNTFIGRGWKNLGASVANCNKDSIGIALIGAFSYTFPTDLQINATQKLIEFGIQAGYISKNYTVVAASQILGRGVGNGKNLFEEVKTWPNWSSIDYFSIDFLKQKFCAEYSKGSVIKTERLLVLIIVLRLFIFLYI